MDNIQSLIDQRNTIAITLREQKAALVNERESLFAERHTLNTAPVNVEDAKGFILDMVDRQAKAYAAAPAIEQLLHTVLYPPSHRLGVAHRPWPASSAFNLADMDKAANGKSYDFAEGVQLVPGQDVYALNAALCYFFQDIITEKLRAQLAACSSVHAADDAGYVGGPVIARRGRLAQIDVRLGQIEQERANIDRDLHAIGITVQAADLIQAKEQDAERDALIVARMKEKGSGYQAAEYGITPDYARYLRQRVR